MIAIYFTLPFRVEMSLGSSRPVDSITLLRAIDMSSASAGVQDCI